MRMMRDRNNRIINITYTEVAITGETGILGFNMRRVGGEYDADSGEVAPGDDVNGG